MPSSFALPQAFISSLVSQTEETFCVIEVEVVSAYPWFQPQEVLDAMKLGDRVLDQEVTVHDQDLRSLEHFQPPEKEGVVQ